MRKILFILMVAAIRPHLMRAQPMNWNSLNQTTNKSVNTLVVYNNQLIAGGEFDSAGVTKASCIASYDGNVWSNLGSGIKGFGQPYVFRCITYNNDLYAVGDFDSAGSVACRDIAKWNGTSWSGFGTGSDGLIYAIAFHNNEMYVAGTFTIIGGIPASNIAKWNGSSWESLGSGINGVYVSDLISYNNELYAVGDFSSAGGSPISYLAKWNGSTWSAVGTGINDINFTFYILNNKLLIGSNALTPNSEIRQWDGSTVSYFSQQPLFRVRVFCEFNSELYCAGGSQTFAGASNVAKWNQSTSTWSVMGSGVNNYIRGLCVYNNELYIGGRFTTKTGAYHNYLAKWGISNGLSELGSRVNKWKVYPNPSTGSFKVDGIKDEAALQVYNEMGTLLRQLQLSKDNARVDLSDLVPGTYFIKIQDREHFGVYSFLKLPME